MTVAWNADSNVVYVFGSNEAGIHGAGAALFAKRFRGAVQGEGFGHHGDSFAIPTKDHNIETLPIISVENYVKGFLSYARLHPQFQFQVTAIGCGLAGFTAQQIAPMFHTAPDNCWFDTQWQAVLGEEKRYWGTFEGGKMTPTPEFMA